VRRAKGRPKLEHSTFVVDANAWIKLWEEIYPSDVFPSLWDEIEGHCEAGRIKVPREVLREVGEGDGVGAWLRAIKPSVALNPTRDVVRLAAEFREIYPALTEGRMGHASADPWIIATGEVHEWVVVCEEKPGGPNKLKIPDVCGIRNVDWITCLEMLRALGVKVCKNCR
jgi:hypothetical protein